MGEKFGMDDECFSERSFANMNCNDRLMGVSSGGCQQDLTTQKTEGTNFMLGQAVTAELATIFEGAANMAICT